VSASPRLVEVRRKVLKENDVIAQRLRRRFQQAGVFVASFVSSPGAGKMALLEKLILRFPKHDRCGCHYQNRSECRGGFDSAKARNAIESVQALMRIFAVSAKDGTQMDVSYDI
jgi:hypothetical protein